MQGTRKETVIRHNAAGIAYEVVNPMGVLSTLALNDRNQPTRLDHNGQPVARLRYDRDGRLAQIEPVGQLAERGWFDRERAPAVSRGHFDREASATVDEFGDVTTLRLADGGEYALEYNEHGQIVAVTDRQSRTTTLEYNPTGRLAAIGFANGAARYYGWNELGDRTATRDHGEGLAEFTHDPGGNLLASRVTGYGQPERGMALELDAYDRLASVTFTGHETVRFEYDKMGNPTRIRGAGTDASYAYDAVNRLTEIHSAGGERYAYEYAEGEPDVRLQMDDRTAPNPSATVRASGTFGNLTDLVYDRLEGRYFEGIRFDGSAQAFVLAEPARARAQRMVQVMKRMRLWDIGDASVERQQHFDTPSNVVFMPPEHRSKNCCPPPPPYDPQGTDPEAKSHLSGPSCSPGPAPQCNLQSIESDAESYLSVLNFLPEPFERGVTLHCIGSNTVSLGVEHTTQNQVDKCRLSWSSAGDPVGVAHSHPKFVTGSGTVVCNGGTINLSSIQAVATANQVNQNFSACDKWTADTNGYPIWMRTPSGTEIKRHDPVTPSGSNPC